MRSIKPMADLRATPRGFFTAAFLGFLALSAAWALAVPINGAPDEREHILRAAGVARGEFWSTPGDFINGGGGLVTAPASFDALTNAATCFAHNAEQPASCQAVGAGGAELGRYPSAAARYFPFYYFLVGLPSLAFSSVLGIYLMRLLSALVNAFFFASALESATESRLSRLFPAGVWAAATPMTFFLSGVVNPNSWEITAALSFWSAGVALLFGSSAGSGGRLIARLAIAATFMLFTRSLAPLWVALMLGVLATAGSLRPVLRAAGSRTVVKWSALVTVAAAASLTWTALARTVDLGAAEKQLSLLKRLEASINLLPARLQESIGNFGWINTPSPFLTYLIWAGVLSLLVLLALSTRALRPRLALLGLMGIIVSVSILLEVAAANRLGFFWQGRYSLPLEVGVPVLAAALCAREIPFPAAQLGRLIPWLIVSLACGQLLALWFAMIRFQSGIGSTLNPLNGSWHPPGGSLPVLILAVAGLVTCTAVVTWGTGRRASSPGRSLESQNE